MIRTDEELRTAQECVTRLQQVLLEARHTHTALQYGLLSKPILFELQARQGEILEYLMEAEAPREASR